jgi:(R,R)-butanediol dehydrogenase/meso-butanediol dehydrogenase/diacetyl reductase
VRALVCTDQGGPLALADLDDPTPGPGEVVVAVEACGICGSDLHMVDALPLTGHVLGHELSGTVAAVGAGVDTWGEGDRVMPLSLATCGQCEACRSGRPRKCASALMVGGEVPGGYAEYVRAPAHDLVPLPDELDLATAALTEPLAVARHAVGRGALKEGETTLVLGAGPVGLAVALWLRRQGAGAVIVSDPAPTSRAKAEVLGVDLALDPTAGDLAAPVGVAGLAAPRRDMEGVGLPGLADQAAAVAALDGRVVVVGVCMADDRYFPFTSIGKELDWRFSFYYCRADVDAAVEALADGSLPGHELVTGEVTLDDASARFEDLKAGNDDTKVLIRP